MKRIVFSIAVVCLLFSCASKNVVSATSQPAEPETPKPEVVEATVPPTAAATNAMTESMFKGKAIFDAKCANCHGLYQPKDFSKEDWIPILKRMQHKAKIEDADMALVNDYVLNSI
ncbi:hypothetical protein [Flavobacterium silvaticum]|uniref:Cytochrome c domain-containing protein n=1 Tax=Flavobacterium silvaticum TaxID=1852020 RepID=A0A972FTY1_9FLAO|nr:hypothetical protein [Flavobacterium silvaticum]NMH27952.1 hypothetical protein [Flavobacterium silvaticum]